MSITVINKPSVAGLTQKKLEGYLKYCELLKWGRCNPVKFVQWNLF